MNLRIKSKRFLSYKSALFFLFGASSAVVMVEPSLFDVLAIGIGLFYVKAIGIRLKRVDRLSCVFLIAAFFYLFFNIIWLIPFDFDEQRLGSSLYLLTTTYLMFSGLFIALIPRILGEDIFKITLIGYIFASLLTSFLVLATVFRILPYDIYSMVTLFGRPKGFFKDPNVLAPYLVPAFSMLSWATLRSGATRRILFASASLICLLGIILPLSRAGWINVGIVIGVQSLIFLIWKPRRLLLYIFIIFGFSIIAISSSDQTKPFLNQVAIIESRAQLESYDVERFQAAHLAFQIAEENVFGIGPGLITKYVGMEPHNTFVKVASETGIVSAIPFFFLLFIALFRTGYYSFARRSTQIGREEAAMLFSICLGLFVNMSVVDAIHWRHFWILLFIAGIYQFPKRWNQ